MITDLTARAQIWIHSAADPPHTPAEFSACEWYGHLSLLEAFLETHPGDLDLEGLPLDEWLNVELRFSYEEPDDSFAGKEACLQKIIPLPPQCDDFDLVRELTAIVRDVDTQFEKTGGSSRHWVRDNFLPALNAEGFAVYRRGITFDWEVTIMNQRMRIEELEKQLRDAGDAMAIQDERIEELRGALEKLGGRVCHLLGREVDKLPGEE